MRHSIPSPLNKPCLQEMQAREDCSATHPSISACLPVNNARATMGILSPGQPWWCTLTALLPRPPTPAALFRASFSSACSGQARSVHHSPSYTLLGIPKASVARPRGSALQLFTLSNCDELVLSPPRPPPALDVVQTSGTKAHQKGSQHTLVVVLNPGETGRDSVPPALPPPRLDFRFPLQRNGEN